jgi:uncharacterized protein DUF2848
MHWSLAGDRGEDAMSETTLSLAIHTRDQVVPTSFIVRHLYLGGWAGRGPHHLQRHIDELVSLGIPPPSEVPILMPMPRHLVTTSTWIEVRDNAGSGEVEYVLLFDGKRLLVTVGSDHTDREMERVDIAKSKQLYPNVIASEAWLYDDVRDHWDTLELTCWVETGGQVDLYQQSRLSELLSAESWLDILSTRNLSAPGTVLFCGTPSTINGAVVYGAGYRFRLTDPVLDRTLEGSYRALPLVGHPDHVPGTS